MCLCSSPSSTRASVSTLSGRSGATSSLVRRSTKGAISLRSRSRAAGSRPDSTGLRMRSLNTSHRGSSPGHARASTDHRSATEFSTGVPVTAKHQGARTAARAAWTAVRGFFTVCASSTTSPENSWAAH